VAKELKIQTPLSDEIIQSLVAGDEVLITGYIFTARDQAHKRLCQALQAEQDLPIDIKGALIYFVGPTPAPDGKPIGSAGPTTSSRMDNFSPTLITQGLKAMIGKGYRSQEVIDALIKYKAVHFCALGGAGALLSKHIKQCQLIAYEDLGTEAIRRLYVEDFPAIVAYDSFGGCVYNQNKGDNF
jgi:fumarate hydratase subunit beta